MSEQLLAEIRERWSSMFSALCDGGDVPPTQRLRTEGLMESAVLQQLRTPEQLDELMDEDYAGVFGRSIAAEFGDDWRDFYPFPQIPAMARRAPVYPSTAD